jgi:hypothetical protein
MSWPKPYSLRGEVVRQGRAQASRRGDYQDLDPLCLTALLLQPKYPTRPFCGPAISSGTIWTFCGHLPDATSLRVRNWI